MNPLFRVPLILLTLILQFCRVANGYCPEAVKSVVKVGSCPTNNQEWETAAKLKNCRITAAEQKCSDADRFVYHCLIDGFENETLEVCAPQKLITGHCTEFNVDGGVIQIHIPNPCGKERFPSCFETYKSSEAYKYQGCYELVYGKKGINSTSIPTNKPSTSYKPENDATFTIIGVVVAIALVVCITIAAIYTYIKKKQQTRKSKDTSVDKEEQDSLIQKPVDNEQGPLRENTAMDDVKEERRPNLKDPEAVTGADKYTFAIVRTVDDLREENEEESKRYLKYYQRIDEYFCETERYKEAEEVFKKNGIVVFTGLPGCGKTIAAIHLIRKELRDWTFRKLYSWEELHLIDDKKQNLVFIDNIFFRRTIDLQLEKWWEKLDKIYDEYFASIYDECEFDRLRIVMTARPNVIEKACAYMGKTTPILYENYLIDVSKLTADEKDCILDKQVEFARKEKKDSVPKIDAEFKRNVRESEGPIGYPLCAHLFVCSEKYQKSGAIFFSRPIEYLKLQIKDEIETDQTKRTKTLFLFLFFFEWHSKMGLSEKIEITNARKCKEFLNKVSKDLLSNFTPCDFRNLEREAQRLLGTFVKEVGENSYKFVHDSVYEAVGAYFCETYVIETAMYFPLDIIQSQEYKNLTEMQMTTIATRLLYEILAQQLSTVFSCKLLQSEIFAEIFCSEIEKKEGKTIEHIFTIANSTVKLPCIFWSSCGNLIYLTERFYDIVRKRKINTDYQLYASLYGICCARSKGLLKTTNGILLDNFELIKNRVLGYQDSDDNSILHLIITSNYSDEFAAFAVEKIVKNKVSIDSTNIYRISPLMLAVEQRLPRTQVIETIVKLSPKLRIRDSRNSTVFHHCLKSDHDDETCAKYLKIIMHGKGAKEALSRDDIAGDTALSIAAKETNRSRIRSILLLLETNADIIDTLNDDGYSPLHLCVRSLKAESAYMELECCIRVITLILYGADPDKLSDKDEKPIDECENDLIKDILRYPHDEKKMENSLKSIQNHFDSKDVDSMKKTEELWYSSKIKSTSLRSCITQSAHFLKDPLINST